MKSSEDWKADLASDFSSKICDLLRGKTAEQQHEVLLRCTESLIREFGKTLIDHRIEEIREEIREEFKEEEKDREEARREEIREEFREERE